MKSIITLWLILVGFTAQAVTTVKQKQVSPIKSSANATKTQKSSSHGVVWLDSISINSTIDEDNDGYTQDIRFTFDLDTNYTSLPVYLELLLMDESGHSTLLTTSDYFTLNSDSLADKQRFDINFDNDLDSGYYHFNINVYSEGNHQLLGTFDYRNDPALKDIRLEGHRYDHHDTFTLFSHDETLSIDNDHDGYYQRINIALDVDSIYRDQQLDATFSLDGRELFHSRPFDIDGTSTQDTQTFDLVIPSKFSSGTYQLAVKLAETNPNNDINHTSTYDLSLVSIESAFNDERQHNDVIIHEGGAFHVFTLLAIGLIFLRRRLSK